MSQYFSSGHRAFQAGGAIGQYLRVKLSSGQLALAGLTDREIGVAMRPAFNANDPTDVLLASAEGTMPAVAAAAITLGAQVWSAASGQVSSTGATGSFLVGIALTAATASGDIIEVLRVNDGAAHA